MLKLMQGGVCCPVNYIAVTWRVKSLNETETPIFIHFIHLFVHCLQGATFIDFIFYVYKSVSLQQGSHIL